MSSAVGMALICACHAFGWPVARGGSQAITDALGSPCCASTAAGSRPGVRVRSLAELPDADAVVLDLAPGRVAEIAGDRLPARVRPRLPALPARARRLQGRPRRRGRRAVDQRGLPPGRHRPRRRHLRGGRRRRARHQPRADARAARSCSSPSSTSPTRRARPATSTRSGPTPTSRPATPATPSRPSSTRSSASRPGLRERIVAPRGALDRPRSPPTTRTSSAATSSPAPTPAGRCVIRPRLARRPVQRPACPASTSARRRLRPAPASHGMNGYNAAAVGAALAVTTRLGLRKLFDSAHGAPTRAPESHTRANQFEREGLYANSHG